jgi:hypothetical protein
LGIIELQWYYVPLYKLIFGEKIKTFFGINAMNVLQKYEKKIIGP